MRKHRHQLDISVGISGPHDFTVREPRARLVRNARPSHPAPNVRDDRDTPLSPRARDVRRSARDLPDVTSVSGCDRLARRANQIVCRRTKKTDVNHQSHGEPANRSLQRLLFQGFPHRGATPESQAYGGDDGSGGQIKCDFLAPIAQKHWKNRGRRQKT
jgi:hypothetical protein